MSRGSSINVGNAWTHVQGPTLVNDWVRGAEMTDPKYQTPGVRHDIGNWHWWVESNPYSAKTLWEITLPTGPGVEWLVHGRLEVQSLHDNGGFYVTTRFESISGMTGVRRKVHMYNGQTIGTAGQPGAADFVEIDSDWLGPWGGDTANIKLAAYINSKASSRQTISFYRFNNIWIRRRGPGTGWWLRDNTPDWKEAGIVWTRTGGVWKPTSQVMAP